MSVARKFLGKISVITYRHLIALVFGATWHDLLSKDEIVATGRFRPALMFFWFAGRVLDGFMGADFFFIFTSVMYNLLHNVYNVINNE